MQGVKAKAAKAAFPYTLPILTGFLFLGIAYGVYMNSLGFSFVYPMIMSVYYICRLYGICGSDHAAEQI